MQSTYNSHVKRIVLGLVVFAVIGLLGKMLLTPKSFGTYGHYRADTIEEEAQVEIRYWTNASCFSCHQHEADIHLKGRHKTISCEFCHGPYAVHITDGKYVAKMPVKRNMEIKTLCLRCHNKVIRARPEDSIKMVEMPLHLEEKKVQIDHNCKQCHMVHDPMLWVKASREMMGMKMKEDTK